MEPHSWILLNIVKSVDQGVCDLNSPVVGSAYNFDDESQ